MTIAFVTGGSGFVGGALVRRLVGDGHTVRALARGDASAARVAELGAEPVRGDLSDVDSLAAGCAGADVVFHAAAWTTPGGSWAEFTAGNVDGTRNVLAAARRAGVTRLVHVGTEAALMAGQPLVNVDESAPLRPNSRAPYPATKAAAELLVRSAEGLETVVVRPRLVWGAGDTGVLPALVAMVKAGRFAWIGGGTHRTATTHIDNTVEGLVLAAERGRPGEAYFVSDGEPVVFREFITELLATQGVEAPTRSVPLGLARLLAATGERAWKLLGRKDSPPLDYFTVWAAGQECTIDIGKARAELGYAPVRTRAEGLSGLRA
ncbi:MAG TPA: NAD-dependent epimerase/dehydratase family protein [Actinophytocola sp.]|uniref:NAD-dependent epimerase/dehydratase family protein n=1 Tax=Actinophytocola sp. TaxID=1872138 RepID=UPI002DBE6B3C|nr:NAD-dependent epimerase/dehydratase family protein [Actinophytocola sp.]HEU5474425.1 NAD-dependent epimerase/dehydratase family protein [Actinophytocola sp.]